MGRFIFLNLFNNKNMETKFLPKDIDITTLQYPAYSLSHFMNTQKIVLTENDKWDIATKSQFIESILLRLPLDPIYVWADKEYNFHIINGRNRLNALYDFLNGKFELQGLKFYSDLNGCTFAQIEANQNKILNTNFIIYCIISNTPSHTLEELSKRFSNPK